MRTIYRVFSRTSAQQLDQQLIQATREGNLELMQGALDGWADINIRENNPHGETPLIIAVRSNNLAAVNWLLERGANVETGCRNGIFPLMYAAVEGNVEIAGRLLASGARIDAETAVADPWTAMTFAAINGRKEMVEYLVNNGARLEPQYIGITTPMIAASQRGHIDTIQLLLSEGANINAVGRDGVTPLRAAVDHRRVRAATLLLAHGCNADENDLTNFLNLLNSFRTSRPELFASLATILSAFLPKDHQVITCLEFIPSQEQQAEINRIRGSIDSMASLFEKATGVSAARARAGAVKSVAKLFISAVDQVGAENLLLRQDDEVEIMRCIKSTNNSLAKLGRATGEVEKVFVGIDENDVPFLLSKEQVCASIKPGLERIYSQLAVKMPAPILLEAVQSNIASFFSIPVNSRHLSTSGRFRLERLSDDYMDREMFITDHKLLLPRDYRQFPFRDMLIVLGNVASLSEMQEFRDNVANIIEMRRSKQPKAIKTASELEERKGAEESKGDKTVPSASMFSGAAYQVAAPKDMQR